MKRYQLLLVLTCFINFDISAKTVNVVAGKHKPPYVSQSHGKISGFEIELIRQIMAKMGLEPEFHLTPYGRSMRMLTQPGIDAIMTASPAALNDKSILTRPYISYQNMAISLASSELNISHVEQLGDYSIAAFQIASKVLGKAYTKASLQSPYYTEVPEQKRQLQMLRQNKVNLVVMDVNIFNHFKASDYPAVSYAAIFPASLYGMAFKEPELVKHFNRVWRSYKKSQQYQELKQKYKIQQQF